jgi:hypothetical protein
MDIPAFRVKHWGARKQRDTYRGYNGYVLERNNRRGGDTALSDSFAESRPSCPIDLAFMRSALTIPAFIRTVLRNKPCKWPMKPALISSCRSNQTFRVSSEGFREQIERFQAAVHGTPERIAPSPASRFGIDRPICGPVPLAPSRDLDGSDPLIVGSLDVFHDAILLCQIARIPERSFLRGMRPRNGIPVQAMIEVVGRPAHDLITLQ